MKKNKWTFLVFCLLLSSFLGAQTSYMLSRDAIIENDSLKGYYFLSQGDMYDKKTNSYEIELYNKSLILAQRAGFLLEKDFEFVSSNVVDKRAFILFRDYHRDLNGNPRTRKIETKMVLFDIDKNKIHKEIDLTKVGKMDFQYLNNKVILNVTNDRKIKNKQIIQLLNNNLDTVWKSWLNDDEQKYCQIEKTYNVDEKNMGMLISKGKRKATFGSINYDFRIFSLATGEFIQKIQLYNTEDKTLCDIKSTFYNEATKEYLLAGNYLIAKDAFFGFKFSQKGLFLITVNLSDLSKITVDKKILSGEKDLPGIKFDETGNVEKAGSLDLKKVVSVNNKIFFIGNFENTFEYSTKPGSNYYAIAFGVGPLSLLKGTEKTTLLSGDLQRVQCLSRQEAMGESSPVNILRNNLWVITLSDKREVVDIKFAAGKKDFTGRKFLQSSPFYADMDVMYYPSSNGVNVLAFFPAKGNSKISKSALGSAFYSFDGSYKSDQFEISEKADWTEYYPARPGYIMVLEYFEKEKKLVPRIEKFNYQ